MMTGCCAKNCHNRAEQGFRLFKFPSDQYRKEIWSKQCGKFPKEHSRLCEYHFDDSQFENGRKDGWRKLKPNAIPTIFLNEESIAEKGLKNIIESSALISLDDNLVDEATFNYNHYQNPFVSVNKSTQTNGHNNAVTVETTYYSNEHGTIRQANEIKYLRKENNLLRAKLEREKMLRLKAKKYVIAYRNLKYKFLSQTKKSENIQLVAQILPKFPHADTKWSLDHCYAKKMR